MTTVFKPGKKRKLSTQIAKKVSVSANIMCRQCTTPLSADCEHEAHIQELISLYFYYKSPLLTLEAFTKSYEIQSIIDKPTLGRQ
jgi:hypothetical protein